MRNSLFKHISEVKSSSMARPVLPKGVETVVNKEFCYALILQDNAYFPTGVDTFRCKIEATKSYF